VTKTLSQELAPENIRVNSILPGWTATERVNHIFEYRAEQNGTDIEAERSKVTATIPMGRMAEPAEFGRVAAFLVSPAASAMTGAMIPVDGGSYAGLL
jgi:3-oxoacyl-[acyl-carrier protein] reductase